jgi:ATP-dependent DNA ligase
MLAHVFDLLHLRGKDLCDRPLDERRELLRSEIMPLMRGEIILTSESLKASAARRGSGPAAFGCSDSDSFGYFFSNRA